MIWNTLHLQYMFYLDMSMIMICLCVLWIVFIIIYHVYGPLNSIAMILILKYNYILYFKKTEAVSFHNLMIVIPLILDYITCFILYSPLMILWFYYSFDDIPAQFSFWLHWFICLKNISLSLNPCSLGSTLGMTSSRAIAGDGGVKIYSLGKNEKD